MAREATEKQSTRMTRKRQIDKEAHRRSKERWRSVEQQRVRSSRDVERLEAERRTKARGEATDVATLTGGRRIKGE